MEQVQRMDDFVSFLGHTGRRTSSNGQFLADASKNLKFGQGLRKEASTDSNRLASMQNLATKECGAGLT